ncbi:MAG: 3-deoxy-D-manno-octulosonic acid kinase [Gammaproteobacteria bacterium]|jgi:3-deoxy-D-manno-octulosonic acid kinase
MHPKEKRSHNQYIIFDDSLVDDISSDDFNVETYRQRGDIEGEALGRGTTYYIKLHGLDGVLRHYRRGGWVSKLVDDRYWWSGLYKTRSWREWYLLGRLRDRDLPVPRAVGALAIKQGLFYRADLLMEKIPASDSLSRIVLKQAIDDSLWRKIGSTLRRFHQRGAYHDDLNAHNILLTNEHDVFLVDFDKGELRDPQRAWQMQNLKRLRRSIDKLKAQNSALNFSDNDWKTLMAGYTQL